MTVESRTYWGNTSWDAQHREDRGQSHRALSRGAPPVPSVAPTDFPMDLDQVKLACRISGSDEDTLIQDVYFPAAVEFVQLDAEITLMTQTRIQYLDDFPDGPIELRMPPISSVTSVTYYDYSLVQQTMSSTLYDVDLTSRPGLISPTFAQVIWPIAIPKLNSIAVTFVCGNANASAVSPLAKQAICLRVGAAYRNREMNSEETMSYDNLIAKLRWRGL
jgi:uncharacterized phiE125 gp8 family phage protein